MLLLGSALLLFLLSSGSADFLQGSIGASSRYSDAAFDSASRFSDAVSDTVTGCFSSDPDEASDSSEPPEFVYDLRDWKLELLLNSRVYEAERVFRDLDTDCPPLRKLGHSGVRVTIREPRLDDKVWLIHKGRGFGRDSNTVVVAARHMSDRWTVKKSKNFHGTKTVRQLRDAGGAVYNVGLKNCHFASEKMFNLE